MPASICADLPAGSTIKKFSEFFSPSKSCSKIVLTLGLSSPNDSKVSAR